MRRSATIIAMATSSPFSRRDWRLQNFIRLAKDAHWGGGRRSWSSWSWGRRAVVVSDGASSFHPPQRGSGMETGNASARASGNGSGSKSGSTRLFRSPYQSLTFNEYFLMEQKLACLEHGRLRSPAGCLHSKRDRKHLLFRGVRRPRARPRSLRLSLCERRRILSMK